LSGESVGRLDLLHRLRRPRQSAPPNLRFRSKSFADYCQLVSDRLGIDFSPTRAYKLCDIRPALGDIHPQEIEGYDYFGYGDIDVIYGNIRRF